MRNPLFVVGALLFQVLVVVGIVVMARQYLLDSPLGASRVMFISGAVTLVGVAAMSLIRFWPPNTNVPPIPFSDDARAVLDGAAREARIRGEDAVTPEHILAALLDDRSAKSVRLVFLKDADFADVRARLLPKCAEKLPGLEQVVPLHTARAHKVLVAAAYEAFHAQSNEAGPLELLAGVLRDDKTTAARALRKAGVTLPQVRAAIASNPKTFSASTHARNS